jgi:hypothetical protein
MRREGKVRESQSPTRIGDARFCEPIEPVTIVRYQQMSSFLHPSNVAYRCRRIVDGKYKYLVGAGEVLYQ